MYGALHIYVIDNASELTREELTDYPENIRLFHNPNTGGSGGFSRGMQEVRKAYETGIRYTNVVLMDDDAYVHPESLYRLHALLSLQKEEYISSVIAGRMFRLDQRTIQYTAAEVWNKGDLRHVGYLNDMTRPECLERINEPFLCRSDLLPEDPSAFERQPAEYSGWWFACFPYEFVKSNDPLPFFLHCDDVEYGLRHGGIPIILNGIQVWHETADARTSAIVSYYDMRNSLIVNDLYGCMNAQEKLCFWKRCISSAHANGDYAGEYARIQGFRDYQKWTRNGFLRDVAKHHHEVEKKLRRAGNVWKNRIAWRIEAGKYKVFC